MSYVQHPTKSDDPYHSQNNGQAVRYNLTIAPRLRHYVREHQKNLDQFVQPLTYAYNLQINASTGTTPFNLTITLPSPGPILEKQVPSHQQLTRTSLLFLALCALAFSHAYLLCLLKPTLKLLGPLLNINDSLIVPSHTHPSLNKANMHSFKDDIAHYKLRHKTISPYNVVSSTLEPSLSSKTASMSPFSMPVASTTLGVNPTSPTVKVTPTT